MFHQRLINLFFPSVCYTQKALCMSESPGPWLSAIPSLRVQTCKHTNEKAVTAAAFQTAKHHLLLQSITEVHVRNTKIHPMPHCSRQFSQMQKAPFRSCNPIWGRRMRQKRLAICLAQPITQALSGLQREAHTHADNTRTLRASTCHLRYLPVFTFQSILHFRSTTFSQVFPSLTQTRAF